jgi:hypothetical protein
MRSKVAHAPTIGPDTNLGRVLINPPCRTGAEMSAFGGKADIFRQGSMRWLHWEIDGFARSQQASRCPSAYS